jgi:lysozyme family protein
MADNLTMGQFRQQQHMPHTMRQSLTLAEDAATVLPEDADPAFKKADEFIAKHEGGITTNDGNQHAAGFGIDQAAHPEMDVTKLTAEQAQAIRYETWRSIGGNDIAKQNPALAEVAYDTAIMSGPERSQQFLKGAQGDPNKFMQERENF